MKIKQYYVYFLTNINNKVLYLGVTNDLMRRVYEHKNKLLKGFTEKYNVNRLVYYEEHSRIEEAILREKQLKKWKRAWKIELIEINNINWEDLYDDLY